MIYGLFMLCLVGYWLGDHGRYICVWPAGCHLVTQVLLQGPPFASHQKFKLVFAGYTSSIGLRGRERHVYVQSLRSVHAGMWCSGGVGQTQCCVRWPVAVWLCVCKGGIGATDIVLARTEWLQMQPFRPSSGPGFSLGGLCQTGKCLDFCRIAHVVSQKK